MTHPAERGYLVRNVVFWAGLTFMFFSISLPFARHLIYILPVLVLLAILGDRSARLGDEAKPFLAFVLAGLILSPLASDEGLKDLYFTFTGVSIALLVDIPRVKLWTLFFILLAAIVTYFSLFGDFRAGLKFDLADSYSSFEGSFSFLFGLLAPLALIEKRYRLSVFCLLMTFISLKRIAVVATICACAFVLFGEKRARHILNPAVMIGLNCLLLLVILLYGFGAFDWVIRELTGQSANQFGQGRRALLSLPALEVFAHPEQFLLYGQGPGSTYLLANKGFGVYGTAQRMHSDVLKIFYEYGLAFFCIFAGLMYSARRFSTRIAFLFMNIVFISDNTLIYSFMLFFFVICTRHFDRGSFTEVKAFPYQRTQGTPSP